MGHRTHRGVRLRRGTGPGAGVLAAGMLLALPAWGAAQRPALTGYYLHALAGVEGTPLSDAAVLDVQRLRLMTRPLFGGVRLDVAYEHTLSLRSGGVALGRGFEGGGTAAPWLGLQGTLVERDRLEWTHALDRLNLSAMAGERARLTLGRQTVSWATTLYFAPGDPFVPFDPADPFREYRAGVDAVRAVVFLGPLAELDAVVRPWRDPDGGTTLTALLRGQGTFGRWDLSAWGGMLHDEAAGAVALGGSAGAVALRGEGAARRDGDRTVLRVAVGADRLFRPLDRDLRVLVEYQHDGLGAAAVGDLVATALSPAARRGELSVLGRDALVLHSTWQVHPLTGVSLLLLGNLRDGSALLAPGLTRSVSDEATLRLGAYLGVGSGTRDLVLRSEYGATPAVGYAALTWFF